MTEQVVNKYPVLRRLVLIQAMSTAVACALIFWFYLQVNAANAQAERDKIRAEISPFIENEQEKLRTWKLLGMEEALQRRFDVLRKEYPVIEIEVLELKDGNNPIETDENRINYPEEFDSDLPYYVSLKISEDKLGVRPGSRWISGILLVAVAVFFSLILYTVTFIRKHIYSPVAKFSEALNKADGASILEIGHIKASGEILDFAVHLKNYYEKAQENQRYFAISRVMQMLAHDVRKPFSTLKVGLDLVGATKTLHEAKEMTSVVRLEVDKALTSVDGMIADVIEVGSNNPPKQEPVSIAEVIGDTLDEIFRSTNRPGVDFEYDLRQEACFYLEKQKAQRVISNLVQNAAQAMKYKGTISFIARRLRPAWAELRIKNSGSYIEPDDLPRLFDVFFTKGKKGGSGLGLAITKKIVEDHGGEVSCNSSHSNGTEFVLKLPVIDSHLDHVELNLPETSGEVYQKYREAMRRSDAHIDLDSDKTIERHIEQSLAKRSEPFRLLVVDDEQIYTDGLRQYLNENRLIASKIVVTEVSKVDTDESSEKIGAAYDAAIIDIDLGVEGLTGFDLVSRVRSNYPPVKICIHSNRGFMEFQDEAKKSGADAFFPKPMARIHLLKFLLSIVAPRN